MVDYLSTCLPSYLASYLPLSVLWNMEMYRSRGLPRWLMGKDSTCQCRRLRIPVQFYHRRIPWRRKWPSCLGNPHGQRSLVGDSPRGPEESDVTDPHTRAPWGAVVASWGDSGHTPPSIHQCLKLEPWHCLQLTLLPRTSPSTSDHTLPVRPPHASCIPRPFARTSVSIGLPEILPLTPPP